MQSSLNEKAALVMASSSKEDDPSTSSVAPDDVSNKPIAVIVLGRSAG